MTMTLRATFQGRHPASKVRSSIWLALASSCQSGSNVPCRLAGGPSSDPQTLTDGALLRCLLPGHR